MHDLKDTIQCPFCESSMQWMSDRRTYFAVVCKNPDCQAEGPFDLGQSGAVEKWNTRPLSDRERALVEWSTRALQGYRNLRELKALLNDEWDHAAAILVDGLDAALATYQEPT